MSDATILDKPEQISAWYFASAISQLTLELKTGLNFYGHKGSVLKGIQQRGWTSVEGRATRKAKVLALSELLDTAARIGLDGPVVTSGEAELERQCDDLGVTIERQ